MIDSRSMPHRPKRGSGLPGGRRIRDWPEPGRQHLAGATAQRAGRPAVCSHRRRHAADTYSSHITLLPRLLAHVRALAPGMVLEAKRIAADLAQAMQAGRADLAAALRLPNLT